jgi:hypothetical protein
MTSIVLKSVFPSKKHGDEKILHNAHIPLFDTRKIKDIFITEKV